MAKLLQLTLAEEEKTDALLTKLSPPLLANADHETEEGEEKAVAPRTRKAGVGQ